MAKDIELMGAVFPDVPAIKLPQYGGGLVQFDDTTDATAAAGDIVASKTAYVNGSKITGNIASKTSSDLTASTLTVTAPAGYYASNASKTLTDSNLTAGNIKKDVSIFGVTGTYEGGGGGGGLVYETGTYTPSSDASRPTINFTNQHNTLPVYISMIDTTETYNSTLSSNYAFFLINYDLLFNGYFVMNSDVNVYGIAGWSYRANNATGISNGTNAITDPSTSPVSSSTQYFRYFASESWFKPYTNSSSRYWRTGRTYKWIAVWKPTA